MSQINNSGPAFPCTDAKGFVSEGMSLRDYFAGQALSGLAASDDHRRYASGCGLTLEQWIERCALEDAQYCYARADAMLAKRQKERE